MFQPDVAVGGPVVKDRAWFFASMRYTDRSTGVSRDATLLGNLNALVPNFQPFDNQGHLKYYFVKGTTQLSPNHQMYVYVQRDANADPLTGAFDLSSPPHLQKVILPLRKDCPYGTTLADLHPGSYDTKHYGVPYG